MKNKILCIVLVFVMIFGAVPVFSSAALSGDIDGDDKVTATDARLVLRCSVNLEKFNRRQKKTGDMDGDGKITAADARTILRMSVGLFDEKPVSSNQYDILTGQDFYMKARISRDGADYEETEIALYDGKCYMEADFDGIKMGMLVSEDSVNLIYHEKKAVLEMDESLLALIGTSMDEITSSDNLSFSKMPALSEMEKGQNEIFEGKDCSVYLFTADGVYNKVYMCGDTLVRLAGFDAKSVLVSDIIVESITAEIPEKCKAEPEGYKLYKGFNGMFSFFGLLENAM